MNLLRIDTLLNKYFEGDTTLREEAELRDLLYRHDLPKEYQKFRDLFDSYGKQKQTGLDGSFDKDLLQKLEKTSLEKVPVVKRINWYIVSSAAAIILLLIVVFVPVKKLPFVGYFSNKIEDTFQDPEAAYAMTMKTLLMVSEKFNNGTRQMAPMTYFGDGIADAANLSKFSGGVNSASTMSKLNEGMDDINLLDKIANALNNAGKLSIINENKSKINNL